jgi:hypothetical protein
MLRKREWLVVIIFRRAVIPVSYSERAGGEQNQGHGLNFNFTVILLFSIHLREKPYAISFTRPPVAGVCAGIV